MEAPASAGGGAIPLAAGAVQHEGNKFYGDPLIKDSPGGQDRWHLVTRYNCKGSLMKSKLVHEDDGQRTFVMVFDTGDDFLALLEEFSARESLSGAQFVAIGAFSTVTLGYFDWDRKDYLGREFAEQVEVASLTGDVALGPDKAVAIHAHCVLGRRDYTAIAGHILKATVRPTIELVLTESPVHLRKKHDPKSGLALIDLAKSS